MKTRHFIDLPSSVCKISRRDARAAVKAGDLAEIQRWTEGPGSDRHPTSLIILYRAPGRWQHDKARNFFELTRKVDVRDDDA